MKPLVKTAVAITEIFALIACSTITPNTVPQLSTQSEAEQTQISAGFTDDEEIPFIIIHPNGEQLAVTQDATSKQKTGVVWVSSEGNSVVIYADGEGNPKGAVVGDDILLYSNYRGNTIDITILHPDGTREAFSNLEIDTTLVNKVKSRSSVPYNLVSFSNHNILFQTQENDFWDFMDYAWIAVGVASCLSAFIVGTGLGGAAGAPAGGVGAVPGATAGAIATFALLVGLCGGVIVDVVIKTAEIHNIEIIPLKTAAFIKNLNDCKKRKLLDWQACGQTLTAVLKAVKEIAYKKIHDNSEGKVILEILPNSQQGQTPECAQLNLTPEECANAVAKGYQETCKRTKCVKPSNPAPGTSYFGCDEGVDTWTDTLNGGSQAWSWTNCTKTSTNVYMCKYVTDDDTQTTTITYGLDGYISVFDDAMNSGSSSYQNVCEAKINK